jgi:hypothetical protein
VNSGVPFANAERVFVYVGHVVGEEPDRALPIAGGELTSGGGGQRTRSAEPFETTVSPAV